jgi:ketosteroid isomerase-like protein
MSMQARDPEELSRLFAERASSGDLEGLLELYEPNAMLISPNCSGNDGGGKAIRERLASLLAMGPSIVSTDLRVVSTGDVALLSNRWRMSFGHGDGRSAGIEGTSTEVARRQPDGSWRYAIDDPASAALRPSEPLGPATSDASSCADV